jgi:polysaccharide deacetylase family protein (PEP-CTERM system associated)
MKGIISVDVEDWFHILDVPSTPAQDRWGALPSRVESNFFRLLELFDEVGVKSTCFFLGYIAERFPHLVREAVRRGHEVASHGYSHQLVYEQTELEFREDIRRAKRLLEDIGGQPVRGYRSPGFSATDRTPWFFEQIVEAGYTYDSSVFPSARSHGGMEGACFAPHVMRVATGRLIELPITVTKVLRRPLCFFGGGYLRLYPYRLIRRMARSVLSPDYSPVSGA